MDDGSLVREWINRTLEVTHWNGDEATIRCPLPSHEDRNPSANANATKRLWHCHRCGEGGTLTELAELLNIEPPAFLGSNPFRPRPATVKETVYPYRNAQSDPVFEVVRRTEGRQKRFLQRHHDESGRQVWKLPPEGRGLPYRYPEVLQVITSGEVVIIVEGEKDADRLAQLGFNGATCNAGGAKKWLRKHSDALLAGCQVVIIPDHDKPGLEHARKVASKALLQRASSVRVVKLGYQIEKLHGRDISDWLNEDPTRGCQEVEQLLAEAKLPDEAFSDPTWAAWLSGAEIPPHSLTTEGDSSDPRPTILAGSQQSRAEWTRASVEALVETGLNDDRRSLYMAARVVGGGSGENIGDVLTLRQAPKPEPGAGVEVPEGTLLFGPATTGHICVILDDATRWLVNGSLGSPRKSDAEFILARYRSDLLDSDRPSLRVLRGIVDSPTLRHDGTLIQRPGYDEVSGFYADFRPSDWQGLPKRPSRKATEAALATLYDLVAETPFAEPLHRAVWLSALLTVVARVYARGNVPLVVFSANVPGAGKGTLVDVLATIATGRAAAKWSPVSGRKVDAEGEERKRLMAIALAGYRIVCIDNIREGDPLGTPALDAALTSGTDDAPGMIADRILGETSTSEAPWRCLVCATGNNLTVRGDMARRALMCRLSSPDAEPETRVFRRHPRLLDHVRSERSRLLIAALTILVAHRDALERGKAEPLPRIGSFGSWSDRIRSAVAWIDPDGCDPWVGNAEIKADAQPEQAEALQFLGAWHRAFGSREIRVREIEERCHQPDGDLTDPRYDADLAEAVAHLSIAPPRGKAALNTRSLGRWLLAHRDRPGPFVLREGKRITGKPTLWFVESQTDSINLWSAAGLTTPIATPTTESIAGESTQPLQPPAPPPEQCDCGGSWGVRRPVEAETGITQQECSSCGRRRQLSRDGGIIEA